ncbi:MAG: EthD domain-containing protein, partial [Candidatus Methylomirabilia bacterium]
MVKTVAFFKRRPGMSVEAFATYWRTTHAEIVSRLPSIRRYVQSHTLLSGYRKGEPVYDGVAELWFDDTQVMRTLVQTPEYAAV